MKLSETQKDKGFAKNAALKTLSSVLEKSGKPSSVKIKIKFGDKEKETKKRRSPSRPMHSAGIRG